MTTDGDNSNKQRCSTLKTQRQQSHRLKNFNHNQNFNLHHRTQHLRQNNKKKPLSTVSNSIDLETDLDIKPCLVHRNSLTSDEDTQANGDNSQAASNSNATIQGILKQSSREASANRESTALNDIIKEDFLSSEMNEVTKPDVRNPLITENENLASGQHQSRSAVYQSNAENNQASFTPIGSVSQMNNKLSFLKTSPFIDQNNMYEGSCPKVNKQRKPMGLAKSSGGKKAGGANTTITLVVDETRFVVDPDIFRQHSNTMLGRMFRYLSLFFLC